MTTKRFDRIALSSAIRELLSEEGDWFGCAQQVVDAAISVPSYGKTAFTDAVNNEPGESKQFPNLQIGLYNLMRQGDIRWMGKSLAVIEIATYEPVFQESFDCYWLIFDPQTLTPQAFAHMIYVPRQPRWRDRVMVLGSRLSETVRGVFGLARIPSSDERLSAHIIDSGSFIRFPRHPDIVYELMLYGDICAFLFDEED